MGTIPTEWKDSDEGGKESEDGCGGCVVGGGGVGGRSKADGVWGRVRKRVRENEVVRGLLDRWRGGRWWLSSPSGEGSKTRVRENEVESVWVGSTMVWFEWESKETQIFTKCFGGNRTVLEEIQNFYCDNILTYCDHIQNFKVAAIKKE